MYPYSLLIKHSKPSGWWPFLVRMRLTRPIAYFFINFTKVQPTTVTLISFLISVLGGTFFLTGKYWGIVIAAICFEIGQILDGVDGLIARIKNLSTPSGAYLDFFLDRVRNVLIIFFIGIGQFLRNNNFSIFLLIFLYIGIKKIYLVSQIYQEKILNDFNFSDRRGQKLLFRNLNNSSFLKKYISFTNKINLSPYYTDLDTDFLVFVLFPLLNKIEIGITVSFILILIITIITNFFFIRLISKTKIKS